MEKERKRALRRSRSRNKWHNRIKELYSYDVLLKPTYCLEGIYYTSWKDVLDAKWSKIYKSTARPCSCYWCKRRRYNRNDFSRETKRMIEKEIFG